MNQTTVMIDRLQNTENRRVALSKVPSTESVTILLNAIHDAAEQYWKESEFWQQWKDDVNRVIAEFKAAHS
jgi:hypothetical protein